MQTLTINVPDSDAARIKAYQENRGITGSNAEHIEEYKRQLIQHTRRVVLEFEAQVASDARVVDPMGIT